MTDKKIHRPRGEKQCSRCKVVYAATTEFFGIARDKYDGLKSQCKSCEKKRYLSRYHGDGLEDFLAQKQTRQSLREQGLRQCKRCNEIYPATLEFFHSQARILDGLSHYCKSCTLEQSKRYRQNRSPEQWARKRDTQRLWEKQPSNKKRMAVYRAIRRARKRSLPDTFTSQDWQRCLDYWGHCCAVCGRPADFWSVLAADHWIPISRGGATIPGNMIPLCHPKKDVPAGDPCCNPSKGDREPLDWLTRRFGKKKAAEIMARVQAYFEWLKNP